MKTLTTAEYYETLAPGERPVFDQSASGFVIHSQRDLGTFPHSYAHCVHALARSRGIALADDEHVLPREREMQGNMQKFASGEWMHLFGPGSRETRCRVLIDMDQSKLVAAQEWMDLKFVNVFGERLKDLSESVIDTNEAHVSPEEWGLEVSPVKPEWAVQEVQQGNVATTTKTTLFWEVDEIIHGKLKPAASGSTTVDGNEADAMAHWDKYFAPHGFRLIRTESA